MKKIWPFLFYLLYYGAASGVFPFAAPYYQSIGLTGGQIGLLLGLAPLITLVGTPFWTGLADSTHRHKSIINVTLIAVILWALAVPFFNAFLVLLVLILVYSFFASPINSLADSATMSMLGEERAMYGRVRLGGTIGWGVMALIAGILIDRFGLVVIFYIFAIGMALNLFVVQKFSFAKTEKQTPFWQGVGKLLTDSRWMLFLGISFVGGIGMATINSYQAVYIQEIGASASLMGIALFISTLSELPVMFFGDRLLKKFKPQGLLILGTAAVGLRMLFYAAFNFPAAVLFVQVFHGFTFPLLWIAGVSFAHENAPEGLNATAQGLFGAVMFGFGSGFGSFVGGLLIDAFSARGMYLALGSFVLVGLLVLSLIQKRVQSNAQTI